MKTYVHIVWKWIEIKKISGDSEGTNNWSEFSPKKRGKD